MLDIEEDDDDWLENGLPEAKEKLDEELEKEGKLLKRRIPSAFQGLYKPARYKVYHGGRGGAKSHSKADALITRGLQRRTRWLCAREIQKSLATSVHQLLVDKIVEHKAQSAYHITRDGIRGPHDTHFLFAGLRTNPDSVKSMEDLDGAWVEEADRCSQTSLDLLTPTVRKPGSELWFSFNRRATTDPVDSLFLGGEAPPNSIIRQVNWRDNPYFPKVLWDEMMWMKGRDHDKWLHVWEGHPLSRTEAKVFTDWEVDDLDEDFKDEEVVARFGADWGFSVDPTVIIKVYRKGDTLYVAREAYKVRCKIDETPALFAGTDIWRDEEDRRWKNPFGHKGIEGAYNSKIVADSARPETIAYMRDRGFTISGAIKGAGSVEEGVEFLKSHHIVVHPSCTHTIDELNWYKYKEDPLTDEVLPILEDRDNHVIDALRYALEADRRALRKRGKIAVFSELITPQR